MARYAFRGPVVLLEEQHLTGLRGHSYRNYASQVGRVVPRRGKLRTPRLDVIGESRQRKADHLVERYRNGQHDAEGVGVEVF